MKLMIASDINGSALYCREMIEAYKREGADRLLILGDILLNGHTHVPSCKTFTKENGQKYTYMNPGSVSIPKEKSERSYIVVENGTFEWKNMEGKVYHTWKT